MSLKEVIPDDTTEVGCHVDRSQRPTRLSYFIIFAGLVIFWALENFWVQASIFQVNPMTTRPWLCQGIRLGLDGLTAATVLLLLPRYWLIACMALDSLLSLIIVAYASYFHRGLSPYYEAANFKEGLKAASAIPHVIPQTALILLTAALAIKILWAWRLKPQPKRFRFQVAALCVGAALLMISALQFSGFSLSTISVGGTRAIYAYGNLTTWIAELYYAPNLEQVAKEQRERQTISPDRLVTSEPPWPVPGNVVVIQLESIGWEILNYHVNGQPVTPFLNQLAQSSRTFKVRSFHDRGSSDMDYAALSGGTPMSRIVSYEVPGITYSNALPRYMQKHGFYTASFHGNSGGFYNRGPNYQRMGFDEISFVDQIQGKARTPGTSWGVRDRDVLNYSSEMLRASSKRQFHFIITLDSHIPFDLIDDKEKQIYPHSKDWRENYFNSARVLDQDVRNYVESLAPGTLVLLYGDHRPGVVYKDFSSVKDSDNHEYIPCIVHLCGTPSSWPEQKGIVAGVPDDLRILDVMNYLRHQVAAHDEVAKPDSQKSKNG